MEEERKAENFTWEGLGQRWRAGRSKIKEGRIQATSLPHYLPLFAGLDTFLARLFEELWKDSSSF